MEKTASQWGLDHDKKESLKFSFLADLREGFLKQETGYVFTKEDHDFCIDILGEKDTERLFVFFNKNGYYKNNIRTEKKHLIRNNIILGQDINEDNSEIKENLLTYILLNFQNIPDFLDKFNKILDRFY